MKHMDLPGFLLINCKQVYENLLCFVLYHKLIYLFLINYSKKCVVDIILIDPEGVVGSGSKLSSGS